MKNASKRLRSTGKVPSRVTPKRSAPIRRRASSWEYPFPVRVKYQFTSHSGPITRTARGYLDLVALLYIGLRLGLGMQLSSGITSPMINNGYIRKALKQVGLLTRGSCGISQAHHQDLARMALRMLS